MFRNKKDVDRHSQEVLRKIKTEKERNLRCLSLAQQYYNVRDYESAKRFVLMYLSVKDESSVAHKLLGQCHEQFNEKDKALQEYLSSLQIDPKQPELILRVCELLCDEELVDKEQAKYWQEVGEKNFPYHPVILKLKKKLYLIEENSFSNSLESTLIGESRNKPDDPVVHTQLLNFYIDNGRVKEAYEEAFSKVLKFTPQIQWYQRAVKICKVYKIQYPNAVREEFYANYLLSLERLLALGVQDVKISRKSITECVVFLARLDEILSEAFGLANQSVKFQQILNHMCGQLCFHTAGILYRKLKWEDNNSQEMNQLILPLLLLSTSKEFKMFDSITTSDNLSRILNICVLQNAYRILQAGFVLHNLGKESKLLIEKIFHLCVANYWKERIVDKVYATSDYKSFRRNSFFINYSGFSNLPSELPSHLFDNIEKNVNIIEGVNPVSLHNLVWLGVNYVEMSGKKSICDMTLSYQFFSRKFISLPFSNSSSSSYAESLCRLDVDSFVYVCVFSAKSYIDQQTASDKQSNILLADVSKALSSPEQEQWWEYAHQMVNKTISENHIPRVRTCLQRGIEEVRLLGCHVMPLPLLVLLGRTFSNRAAVESDSDRASALEARASLYWKTALPLLEKIVRDEVSTVVSKSMFDYHRNIITKTDAIKLVEEGKCMVRMHEIKAGNYSETLTIGDDVNESFGDFNVSTSSKAVTNVGEEKIIQTIIEQNQKIMDKLDTLFLKQELLCSNQLQLFEAISTLTKKAEGFSFPEFDECFDKLLYTPITQAQIPITAQSNVINLPNVVSPKVQTNFPMSSFTQYNSNLNSFPNRFNFNKPVFPNNVLGDLASYIPHNNDASLPATLPSKLEPKCGVISTSAYVPPFSMQSSVSTPSFISNLNTSQSNVSFIPAYTSPQSSFTFSPEPTKVGITSSILATSTPAVSFMSLVSKNSASVSSTTFVGQTPTVKIPSASGSVTGQTPTHSFQIPVPETSVVIKSPPVEVPEYDDDDDDDHHPVEHDPLPDFKPIIPLPDMVDVVTGEEDETILYENRVKLFRFVDKEWKERGVGIYKLLKNNETGRVRVLMRRETVHKVCANHFLTEELTLSPMVNSDRAWVYCTPDFADEKMQVENFCVKFKTPEDAQKFYELFNTLKKEGTKTTGTSPVTPGKIISSNELTNSATSETTSTSHSPIVVDSGEKHKKIVIAPPVLNIQNESKNETPEAGFKFGSEITFANLSSTVDKEKVNAEEKPKAFEFKAPENKTPFAGFTGFRLDTLQPSTFSKLFESKDESGPKNLDPSTPFGVVTNTLDFSSLTSNGSNAFTKNKNFKGFQGAGSLVFGGSADKSKVEGNVSSSVAAILKNVDKSSTSEKKNDSNVTPNESVAADVDEDFVPTQEFAPVIPLPDVVEVVTGEEGLKVLYEERCKLFRFVGDEWKERGIGNMKILRDPNDGSIRLLMRREQVYKLCCNQRLTADHELKPLSTSDKAWSWHAGDFSEGELKPETFCVRFKTEELAAAFHKAFYDAKALLSSTPKKSVSSKPTTEKALPKLSEMFKPAAGSWECKICYVSNKKEDDNCVSCTSPRDPNAPKPTSTNSIFGLGASNLSNKISFGIPPTSSPKPETTFTFGVKKDVVNEPEKSDKSPFKFGEKENSVVPAANVAPVFSFGNGSSNSLFSFGLEKDAKAVTTESSVFTPIVTQSNIQTSVFSFGNGVTPLLKVADENNENQQNTSITMFQFQSTKTEENASIFGGKLDSVKTEKNVSIFGGGGLTNTVFGSSTNSSFTAENTSGAFSNFSFKLPSETTISQADKIQTFSPFHERVPLLINDRNERTLFKSSAQLRIYKDGKPEQVSGEVFILSNSETKKIRLLMKREPSQIVFFNHFLEVDTVFKRLYECCWQWTASDFSKGEISKENFLLAFRNSETANEFKSVIDSVQKEMTDGSSDSPGSSEVEFISEIKVNEEDRKLAESLQLPSNYFNYKLSADCPGCAGCDEEDKKKIVENKENSAKNASPALASTPVKSSLFTNFNFGSASNKSSVFGDITNDNSWPRKGALDLTNVFNKSNTEAPSPARKSEEESDGEDSVVKNDHEPHFEPIIPLPGKVEVRTGEEDEEIRFCKRAKLYRFDGENKEWKERGVGELKVLYHPELNSFRLLLRREQIHKVVLNQRLSTELNLQSMSNNNKSWCWVAPNLPEEQSEPILESLAVRFKDETTSNEFFETIQNSVYELGSKTETLEKTDIEEIYDGEYEDRSDVDDDGHGGVYQYVDEGDDYIDEEAIGEAIDDEEGELLFERPVHVKVMEEENAVESEGRIHLMRKYDEHQSSNVVSSIVFSTPNVTNFYNIDITDEMNLRVQGDGCITVAENNEDKMELLFESHEDAEEFNSVFYSLRNWCEIDQKL